MKPEILKSYDEAIKEALTDILNLNSITESIWNQCTLPVKDGGLGIRSAEELALPFFQVLVHQLEQLDLCFQVK